MRNIYAYGEAIAKNILIDFNVNRENYFGEIIMDDITDEICEPFEDCRSHVADQIFKIIMKIIKQTYDYNWEAVYNNTVLDEFQKGNLNNIIYSEGTNRMLFVPIWNQIGLIWNDIKISQR